MLTQRRHIQPPTHNLLPTSRPAYASARAILLGTTALMMGAFASPQVVRAIPQIETHGDYTLWKHDGERPSLIRSALVVEGEDRYTVIVYVDNDPLYSGSRLKYILVKNGLFFREGIAFDPYARVWQRHSPVCQWNGPDTSPQYHDSQTLSPYMLEHTEDGTLILAVPVSGANTTLHQQAVSLLRLSPSASVPFYEFARLVDEPNWCSPAGEVPTVPGPPSDWRFMAPQSVIARNPLVGGSAIRLYFARARDTSYHTTDPFSVSLLYIDAVYNQSYTEYWIEEDTLPSFPVHPAFHTSFGYGGPHLLSASFDYGPYDNLVAYTIGPYPMSPIYATREFDPTPILLTNPLTNSDGALHTATTDIIPSIFISYPSRDEVVPVGYPPIEINWTTPSGLPYYRSDWNPTPTVFPSMFGSTLQLVSHEYSSFEAIPDAHYLYPPDHGHAHVYDIEDYSNYDPVCIFHHDTLNPFKASGLLLNASTRATLNSPSSHSTPMMNPMLYEASGVLQFDDNSTLAPRYSLIYSKGVLELVQIPSEHDTIDSALDLPNPDINNTHVVHTRGGTPVTSPLKQTLETLGETPDSISQRDIWIKIPIASNPDLVTFKFKNLSNDNFPVYVSAFSTSPSGAISDRLAHETFSNQIPGYYWEMSFVQSVAAGGAYALLRISTKSPNDFEMVHSASIPISWGAASCSEAAADGTYKVKDCEIYSVDVGNIQPTSSPMPGNCATSSYAWYRYEGDPEQTMAWITLRNDASVPANLGFGSSWSCNGPVGGQCFESILPGQSVSFQFETLGSQAVFAVSSTQRLVSFAVGAEVCSMESP